MLKLMCTNVIDFNVTKSLEGGGGCLSNQKSSEFQLNVLVLQLMQVGANICYPGVLKLSIHIGTTGQSVIFGKVSSYTIEKKFKTNDASCIFHR